MALALVLWVLLVNGYGLGALEYVRHTEADRTLISMEMVENNNYLVPTLVGSEILTKPPLFYWLTAFLIKTLNSPSELVARLSSLLSGSLMVALFYLYSLSFTTKKRLSGLMALALSTSMAFYVFVSVAEIDMIFACFCVLSIIAAYDLYENQGVKKILIFSAFVTLAFLAKGPPVYFFTLGAIILWSFIDLVFYKNKYTKVAYNFSHIVAGLILATLILLIWLLPLGEQVGWELLKGRLHEEVFNRVTDFSERGRGAMYYVLPLFLNSLPWSIFLLFGIFHFFRVKASDKEEWYNVLGGYFVYPQIRRYFCFCCTVVLSGFMMLSIAQGKSTRYAFPLIPFFVNIAVILSPIALTKHYYKKVLLIFRLLCIASIIAFIGIYVFGDLQNISKTDWIISAISIGLITFYGLYCSPLTIWRNAVFIILMQFIVIKMLYVHLYIPHRNATRGVQMLVHSLVNAANSINQQIYTIELFSRWTIYYAKREGVNVKRLDQRQIDNLVNTEGRTYILLDHEEESWRYYEALIYSKDVKLEKIFPHPTSAFFLISVPNNILNKLSILSYFPTHPSFPFYGELIGRQLGQKN